VTRTKGIFIAGCIQWPKDIPASMTQGAVAAARILGKIHVMLLLNISNKEAATA